MRRLLLDITIVVALATVGALTWVGQQRAPDPFLQRIERSGVLRVGTDPTYPPFETLRDGKVVGYDAELAHAIADDLGVRVEFQTLALDTLYDALAAGKVDVLVSALPFVYERQREIRYSTPYYQAGQVLLVRVEGSGIASIADLDGKMVGVELGSAADTEARKLARSTVQGMKLQSIYHLPEDALSALAGGEVDAVITDSASAWAYLRDHPRTLGILPITVTDEPYVVAMPAQATGLAARVDATIGRLRASGELARMMGMELRP
ncbi:MAG: ABC transporter substrate-binding protein [Chloroflexota bacterium]|nr:ABC transporter substrate-binding protein [Chloroflexota bacterium]